MQFPTTIPVRPEKLGRYYDILSNLLLFSIFFSRHCLIASARIFNVFSVVFVKSGHQSICGRSIFSLIHSLALTAFQVSRVSLCVLRTFPLLLDVWRQFRRLLGSSLLLVGPDSDAVIGDFGLTRHS